MNFRINKTGTDWGKNTIFPVSEKDKSFLNALHSRRNGNFLLFYCFDMKH